MRYLAGSCVVRHSIRVLARSCEAGKAARETSRRRDIWSRYQKRQPRQVLVNPLEIPTGAVEVVAERIWVSAPVSGSAPKLS
jgi:hypothetical protein